MLAVLLDELSKAYICLLDFRWRCSFDLKGNVKPQASQKSSPLFIVPLDLLPSEATLWFIVMNIYVVLWRTLLKLSSGFATFGIKIIAMAESSKQTNQRYYIM